MGFRRSRVPLAPVTGESLLAALAGLGMAFAVTPHADANIEDTVLAASVAGMEEDDFRILGVLVTWLDLHHSRLLADRLVWLVQVLPPSRTTAFWSAMALRWATDRRWARLAHTPAERIPLLRVGSEFLLRRHGEDPRFVGTGLVVPCTTLRDRPADVVTPSALAKLHRAYHNRVLMGPSYRADLWAALEADPSLSPSELARRTYASFASAWQVKRDFAVVAA